MYLTLLLNLNFSDISDLQFKENHRWDSLKDKEPVLYDFVKRMSKQRDAKNQSSSTKYALEKLEEFSFPWGVLKSGAGRPKKLKNKDQLNNIHIYKYK